MRWLNRKSQKQRNLRQHEGFGLVEVLVVTGILGIAIAGTASLITSQFQMTKSLNQKLEILQLENAVMRLFLNSDVCTWQLKKGAPAPTIDVTGVTATNPSPTTLDLGELYMGDSAASPGLLVAKSGQRLPASTSNIGVASVAFKDIYATGVANEYQGMFEIGFDPTTLAYPMQPVRVRQIVKTEPSDPDNAKHVRTCAGSIVAPAARKMIFRGGPTPHPILCAPGTGPFNWTTTKLTWNVVSDTESMYNAGAKTFTPPAGRWLLTTRVYMIGSLSGGFPNEALTIHLFKNGVVSVFGETGRAYSTTGHISAALSTVLEANGTDVFEVVAEWHNCPGSAGRQLDMGISSLELNEMR